MTRPSIANVTLEDVVRVTVRNADGSTAFDKSFHNTITNWARAALSAILIGQPLMSPDPTQQSLPLYISLGTGAGTPQPTDVFMFSEVYGTRKQYSYRSISLGYIAQVSANYQVSDPNGTFTEAGLWDGTTQSATLSTAANAGDATLYLAAGAPAVAQGEQIYLSNGTDSEYVTVSQAYAADTAAWNLNSKLQNAYSANTTVTVFGANLWGHVMFSGNGATKDTGQTLTVQWSIIPQAS